MLCRDSTDCEPPTIGIYWIYCLWIRDSIRRVEKLRAFQALDVGRIWKTTCNFTAVGYPWVGPKMVNIPPQSPTYPCHVHVHGEDDDHSSFGQFQDTVCKAQCLICPTWLWVWKLGSRSKFVPSRKPQSSGSSLCSKFHDFWTEVCLCRSAQWPTSQPTWADQHWTALDRASDPAKLGFSWIFMDIVHKQTEVSDGICTTPKDIVGVLGTWPKHATRLNSSISSTLMLSWTGSDSDGISPICRTFEEKQIGHVQSISFSYVVREMFHTRYFHSTVRIFKWGSSFKVSKG